MKIIKLKQGCSKCGNQYLLKEDTQTITLKVDLVGNYVKAGKLHRFRCKCKHITMITHIWEKDGGILKVVKNEKLC